LRQKPITIEDKQEGG
jgi:ribosome production factor 1